MLLETLKKVLAAVGVYLCMFFLLFLLVPVVGG